MLIILKMIVTLCALKNMITTTSNFIILWNETRSLKTVFGAAKST